MTDVSGWSDPAYFDSMVKRAIAGDGDVIEDLADMHGWGHEPWHDRGAWPPQYDLRELRFACTRVNDPGWDWRAL